MRTLFVLGCGAGTLVSCTVVSPLGDLTRCDGKAVTLDCPDVGGETAGSGGNSGTTTQGGGGGSAGNGEGGVPTAGASGSAGAGGASVCSTDAECAQYFACLEQICVPALRVSYADNPDENTDPKASKSIRPYLRLINYGSETFPLSELSLRYYYTIELSSAEAWDCMYSRGENPSCSAINVAFGDLPKVTPTANHYFVVSFTEKAGTLGPHGAQSDDFKLRIFKSDGSAYDQTNDFSYDASKTTLIEASHVALYHNAKLVWGTEP